MTPGRQDPVDLLPRKRVAATMLLTDPGGRVLAVKPTYKPGWELPGGIVEDGESPRTAARREVAEELGIDRAAGALLAVDYVPADGARPEGLILVFDGGHDRGPRPASPSRRRAERLGVRRARPRRRVPAGAKGATGDCRAACARGR